jgi:hypothetical protein
MLNAGPGWIEFKDNICVAWPWIVYHYDDIAVGKSYEGDELGRL